jgi:MFS family permease
MSEQANVNAGRLFLGSCLSLIATSVAFAVIGDIMGTLKNEFVLTNAQVGMIGGAALWGFTLSMIALGPLCDALGMKRLLNFAFLCHLAGPLIMIFANGFGMLFTGALVLALGNGTVEAACNPLVATLYPENKTVKLNQFHVWFPGGIVIGGLLCFALSQMGNNSWQLRLCLVMIPAIIYGILFIGQNFPATERVQSGISFGGMCKATFLRPFFWVMFICMGITASLELGPNRWIPAILQSGGMHGILVLVYITGLMAVLRQFAGSFVHKLSPPGLLCISAVLAGAGLYWLSFAESLGMAIAAATVFALGVCFFWPTMLGVVSERIPKGGALALAMMGGMGMLASGMIASPLIGTAADTYLKDRLPTAETTAVLQRAAEALPLLQAEAGELAEDLQPGIDAVNSVLVMIQADPSGELPHPDTANALRAIISSGADSVVVVQAADILNPADNYGGRMSFRLIAPFAGILIIVFGTMYLSDKRKGGYKAEEI